MLGNTIKPVVLAVPAIHVVSVPVVKGVTNVSAVLVAKQNVVATFMITVAHVLAVPGLQSLVGWRGVIATP
jgi:hypothetical protein